MHSSEFSFEQLGTNSATTYDMELMKAAQAGSETAFAEMHNLYAQRLYRTIFSITRNHEDAQDALQDTLLRAYTALDSFEGRSKVLSWLTRIAINSALMIVRKRGVRRGASFEPAFCGDDNAEQIQVKDPRPNPEEVCLQLETRRRVMRAMTGLKPKSRVVIQLRMSRECSMQEIAQSLDVSIPAVKSRLHSARRRLATLIQ